MNSVFIDGTVRILKNQRLSSLFANPIMANLDDFTNEYNKKFHDAPFKISFIPETQESIIMKIGFYAAEIELRLEQLIEETLLFLMEIY